jgi:hypothetical protein
MHQSACKNAYGGVRRRFHHYPDIVLLCSPDSGEILRFAGDATLLAWGPLNLLRITVGS